MNNIAINEIKMITPKRKQQEGLPPRLSNEFTPSDTNEKLHQSSSGRKRLVKDIPNTDAQERYGVESEEKDSMRCQETGPWKNEKTSETDQIDEHVIKRQKMTPLEIFMDQF